MKTFFFLLILAAVFIESVVFASIGVLPLQAPLVTAVLGIGVLMIMIPGFTKALLRSEIIPSLAIAFTMGFVISIIAGMYAWAGAGLLFGVSLRFSRAPSKSAHLILRVGLYKEVWLAELVVPFREQFPWLELITDSSKEVQILNGGVASVINSSVAGVDPAVLLNNTTYPIVAVQRTDTNTPITLDKFDTTTTTVTADELRGLHYDKIKSVTSQHGQALAVAQASKAIHAMGPLNVSTTATPVVRTTGAARSDDATRKRAQSKDIIMLARKFDLLKIARDGKRVLVLHPNHHSDLLEENTAYTTQFANTKDGTISDFHGFKIFVGTVTPVYNDTTGNKAAYGAAAAGTDRISSVAYYTPRMFRASGNEQMFSSLAENDPDYRQTKVGFRQDFICLPKTNEAIGAIVDDEV